MKSNPQIDMKLPFQTFVTSILTCFCLGTTTAAATDAETVFDNTVVSFTVPVFGPSGHQVGNKITLGGTLRQISQISWLIDPQHTDLLGKVETHIYANDGGGGAPGTLLWSSGLLTDIPVSANQKILPISVPNILVPDVITVTSQFLDATPVALGRVYGGSPTVGNLSSSWVESSPGIWGQQFGPWGMEVLAVPEPSVFSLMIVAVMPVVATFGRRDGRS